MISTINFEMQFKFTKIDFNNDYLMLASLKIHYQLTRFSKFIRLLKKYYTLQCKTFTSILEYFIHIKVLEEKIDVIKIIFDSNNRIIFCFSMLLSQEYQYLIQIWVITLEITIEKAC